MKIPALFMTLMLMLTLCGNTVGSMSQPQTKEALLHSRTDTQPEPEIRKRFQLFKKAMKTKSKQLRKENRGRAGKAALLAAGISLMTLAITAVAGLQSFFAVLIFSLAAIVGLIFGVVGIIRAKREKNVDEEGRKKRESQAIVGIILSLLSIGFQVLFWIDWGKNCCG